MQRLMLATSVCRRIVAQILLAASLVLLSHDAMAQQTGKDAPAAISGTIKLNDGKDSPPARNIIVVLLKNDSIIDRQTPAAKTTTDGDGHYKFINVAAGKYRIAPFAPAFALDDAQPSFFGIGKELNVSAGENIEDLNFTLTRGGVITGRVTDSDGKPVIEQLIAVYKLNETDAKKSQPVSPYRFLTDDRGIYRVYGLAPGKYLVSVGEAKENGSVSVGRGSTYYLQTFYPNAPDMKEAKIVEVSSGSEATDIDIQIQPAAKTYSVSGRVVDEDGQPVADAVVVRGAVSADGRFMGAMGLGGERTDENGEFQIKGLVPGHQAVWATLGSNPFQGDNQSNLYSDAVTLDINDADVNGVEIKMHTGATISGTVAIDGAQTPAALAKLKNLDLGVSYDSRTSPPSFLNVKTNADGSFHITGVRPGKVQIRLFNSQSNGLQFIRVERDGVAQNGGIDVAPQENVTGVRVVVAYGANTLHGQINFTNGTLPGDARAIIMAKRTDSPSSSFGTSTTADARGKFTLENLVAGTYEINVNASSPTRGFLGSTKTTVTVNDGEESNVGVTIDLSKTPMKGAPRQ